MSLSISGRTWEEATSPTSVQFARRYETEWRQATSPAARPKLEQLLAEAGPTGGARLALLRADMGLRWEAGERILAATYRERFPNLEDEAFVALVYEEFCIREEEGEDPREDVFLARYPEVSAGLQRVFQIHELVGSGMSSSSTSSDTQSIPFPETGETIAGFRLVEELGRGSFARVFLAEERQLSDRPVALKVAVTGSREPQTLARLQHTHIVPVYSSRTDPASGLHVLCMPYYGRVTLAHLLDDPKIKVARSGIEVLEALDRLNASEVPWRGRATGRAVLQRCSFVQAIAWWGARMAEGLAHAHERGVLHRDVKPSNVLVTSDGMPMLLDFNLARVSTFDPIEHEMELAGGTFDYMAPEHLEDLAEGQGDRVDARSDIYSLGVLLYEALMSSRPFARPRGAASAGGMFLHAAEVRRAAVPRLRSIRPDVPAALDAIVRRCLAPCPDERYQSAADLAVDLQAFAEDLPLKFAREPWLDRSFRWLRSHNRLLATAIPVFIALVLIGAHKFREQAEHDRMRAKVCSLYDEGWAAELSGDFTRAKLSYETAARLVDQPEPVLAGANSSVLWSTLEEIRQQARHRYRLVSRIDQVRSDTQRFLSASESLMYRIAGLGGDRSSVARDLERALAPFHVFEAEDWLQRPDLRLLEDDLRNRLISEINELLFLWALALERAGDPASAAQASQVCDRALRFAAPDGPWLALRARLQGEHESIAPSSGETSARACFQWGALLLSAREKGRALEFLEQAVRFDSGNTWYHVFLGYACEKQTMNDGDEAIRHYEAAVALAPQSPWVRYRRALRERDCGNPALALEDLRFGLSVLRALPDGDRDSALERQITREIDQIESLHKTQ